MERQREMSASPPKQKAPVDDREFTLVPMSAEEAENKPHKMRPRRLWLGRFNDYWIWEAGLCLVSVVALVCVVGVLWVYDGKPLPSWPYGTTINSVLSWITQVLTACMVGAVEPCLSQSKWIYFSTGNRSLDAMDSYDWASRGPLGCLVFMWTSKMRRSAVIGALITILAIGVGPFVQQMAAVVNQHVQTNDPATVARGELFYETSYHSEISTNATSAISSAIFDQSNSSRLVMPNCPTGNCKFPLFRSLAVCSSCSDVSHLLSSTQEHLPCDSFTTTYKHTLPNGVHLNITDSSGWMRGYISTRALPNYENPEPLPGTKDFGNSTALDFTAISVATGANRSDASAHHCSLYWCINTYSVNMTNNIMNQTLVNSYYDPSAGIEVEGLVLHQPAKDNLTATRFNVHQDSSIYLNEWLVDKFSITNEYDSYCVNDEKQVRVSSSPTTNDYLQPILNSRIPDLFERLAKSLTAHIRKGGMRANNGSVVKFGISPAEPAHGVSWIMQTQIQVRWAWIILPAALILSTVIFVLITIAQTKRRGLGSWKSASMPLLASGLDQKVQHEMRTLGNLAQAENLAEDVYVRLVKDPDANSIWRLDSGDNVAR